MKRILFLMLILALAGSGWLAYKLNDRPSLAPYAGLWLEPSGLEDTGIRVTWLGVSTILIEDGETAIMTDGFFSRPGLLKTAATRLSPDRDLITQNLNQAGVDKLSAVFVVHSHYDHVMDSPKVAEQTGALLVGSESTVNVGRGWGLTENRMAAIKGGEQFKLGKFTVTAIKSKHLPPGKAMGEISAPLTPPARATEYLEGGSYSFHIEHEGRRLLIQGSAGYVEGALENYPADVVMLGIGLLGTKDLQYQQSYWHEMVETTGAKRVIPIHWDDFFLPLTRPLEPFPSLLDNFDASMTFIQSKAKEQEVEINLIKAWSTIDPFVGL